MLLEEPTFKQGELACDTVVTLPINDEESDDEGGDKKSQSSALVAFVNEYVDLVHDKNADVFAQDKKTKEVAPH